MANKTMTVKDALHAGYSQCLQDGRSFVEDIDDVDSEELKENTYWICEQDPDIYQIKDYIIKDRLIDYVADQEEVSDDDSRLPELIRAIPDQEFEALTKLVNQELAKRRYWPTTDIRLIPNPQYDEIDGEDDEDYNTRI